VVAANPLMTEPVVALTGVAPVSPPQLRLLTAVERIANSLEWLARFQPARSGENVVPMGPAESSQFGSGGANGPPEVSASASSAGTPADGVAELRADLAEIKLLLQKQQKVVQPLNKTSYTVSEVAEATGYSLWTLRHACNKGRIKADKGPNGQWRIKREQLLAIQNEGLPPEHRETTSP
jgi:hypothetical protein